MLVQQSKERQQHPASATTTTTSAVSTSRHIRSAHLLHASRRHHYLQLSAATTTTTSTSISTSTTNSTFHYIYVICDKSVHTRTSCYDINQLNREHLRDLPRGLLRRWGKLCDTVAVTSVAPRNFADHDLFNHTTLSLLFLQVPINPGSGIRHNSGTPSSRPRKSFSEGSGKE